MYPTLPILNFPTYGVFVALGIFLGSRIRRLETERLGYVKEPGHAWVGIGALAGAMVGSKVGMLLFIPPEDFLGLVRELLRLDFTGKTVVGGMIGGYLGVEVTKKIVGIRQSTGDGFAVAVAVAQGIGRIGCFFNGCCFGRESDVFWAVDIGDGLLRHPAPLYESALTLGLAGWLWGIRKQDRPRGYLFRYFLIGFAGIRLFMEFLRGDNGWSLGPLTGVQWLCLLVMAGFGYLVGPQNRGAPGVK